LKKSRLYGIGYLKRIGIDDNYEQITAKLLPNSNKYDQSYCETNNE